MEMVRIQTEAFRISSQGSGPRQGGSLACLRAARMRQGPAPLKRRSGVRTKHGLADERYGRASEGEEAVVKLAPWYLFTGV